MRLTLLFFQESLLGRQSKANSDSSPQNQPIYWISGLAPLARPRNVCPKETLRDAAVFLKISRSISLHLEFLDFFAQVRQFHLLDRDW